MSARIQSFCSYIRLIYASDTRNLHAFLCPHSHNTLFIPSHNLLCVHCSPFRFSPSSNLQSWPTRSSAETLPVLPVQLLSPLKVMLSGMPFSNPPPSAPFHSFSRSGSSPLVPIVVGTSRISHQNHPVSYNLHRPVNLTRPRRRQVHAHHHRAASLPPSRTQSVSFVGVDQAAPSRNSTDGSRHISSAPVGPYQTSFAITNDSASPRLSFNSSRRKIPRRDSPDMTLFDYIGGFNSMSDNFLKVKVETTYHADGIVDMLGGPNTGYVLFMTSQLRGPVATAGQFRP